MGWQRVSRPGHYFSLSLKKKEEKNKNLSLLNKTFPADLSANANVALSAQVALLQELLLDLNGSLTEFWEPLHHITTTAAVQLQFSACPEVGEILLDVMRRKRIGFLLLLEESVHDAVWLRCCVKKDDRVLETGRLKMSTKQRSKVSVGSGNCQCKTQFNLAVGILSSQMALRVLDCWVWIGTPPPTPTPPSLR